MIRTMHFLWRPVNYSLADGNKLTARTDFEKVEVLGNFFASVFNRESEFAEASITQSRPCQFSSRDLVISKQIILKKLNNLNVTKSPGPDNHPRILYEIRYKLAIPLKILFETSYSLGQLPADWKIGNITAFLRKVIKVIHLIIDQLV